MFFIGTDIGLVKLLRPAAADEFQGKGARHDGLGGIGFFRPAASHLTGDHAQQVFLQGHLFCCLVLVEIDADFRLFFVAGAFFFRPAAGEEIKKDSAQGKSGNDYRRQVPLRPHADSSGRFFNSIILPQLVYTPAVAAVPRFFPYPKAGPSLPASSYGYPTPAWLQPPPSPGSGGKTSQ